MTQTLLTLDNVSVELGHGASAIRPVDNASLEIRKGETYALLGESGCGKSMTALSILRLLPQPAGRITGGRIELDGTDLTALPEGEMRGIRGRRIAMIFQEPMTSLNPVFTCGDQIMEALTLHMGLGRGAARKRAIEMLAKAIDQDVDLLTSSYVSGVSVDDDGVCSVCRSFDDVATQADAWFRTPADLDDDPLVAELETICREFSKDRKIGPDDNLFEVGVSSLTLTEIVLAVEEKYPGKLDISDLFDYPTLRDIADFMRR